MDYFNVLKASSAFRRCFNNGGDEAGGSLRESPKIPTTSIAKDTQVLLPAFCLDPKPSIPREMTSDAPLATLAILKFLEPRPVAADMQFAATNSLLEFMSHSAAVMEPVLGTAPIEASKIDSKCAAETPTSGAADSVPRSAGVGRSMVNWRYTTTFLVISNASGRIHDIANLIDIVLGADVCSHSAPSGACLKQQLYCALNAGVTAVTVVCHVDLT